MKITRSFLFLTLGLFSIHSIHAEVTNKPNVVLIFADDLGYGDLGCYGAVKLKTPNIDLLAAQGRKFTDAHSASAVCTPSRYGLLTGEYPFRANGGKGIWGPAPFTSPLLIDPDKRTIADIFKSAGYDTAVFGKWHLGFGNGKNLWNKPLRPGPQDLGFDYYFGMPVVNSAPPYVYVENDKVVGAEANDPLIYIGHKAGDKATPLTPIPKKAGNRVRNFFSGATKSHKLFNDYQVGLTITEKATGWIKSRKNKPFFLYLATTQIHHPFTPAPRFQGTSDCGLYGDFVHELDWMVGEVVKTLKEQGIADNTLIIFTSDNGGMFNRVGQRAHQFGHRQNADLLGFKFGVWEGGHRVPFIAKWPGKIKPGTTSDQLISGVDMFATMAAVVGQKVDEQQATDSINVLPALTGEPEVPLRETLFLQPHRSSHLAVRQGKWIYIGARGAGGFTGGPGTHASGGPVCASFVGSCNSDFENGKYKEDAPQAQLYDLENDPNQTKNVLRKHPKVAQALRALLENDAPQHQKSAKHQATSIPTKYDHFKPVGNLRFTFESGKLDGWRIVEGKAGRPVSAHASLPKHKSRPFNHQGKHHLSTIATRNGFSDKQQVVFQSPKFIIQGNRASFLTSGGFQPGSLYVGLVDAKTQKVLLTAGGSSGPQMKRIVWNVSKLKGKAVYLQVVDQSTQGWGHLTFDDFSVEGKRLTDDQPTKTTR